MQNSFPTITAPDTYRILFVNANNAWFERIQQAFCRNPLYAALLAQGLGMNAADPQLIELVHAIDWQEAEKKIVEGNEAQLPFALAVVEIGVEDWEHTQRKIEDLWEIDASLHWVCCLPQDSQTWPSPLSLSRPFQWMMLRSPFVEEELIQLVWIWAGNWIKHARWSGKEPGTESVGFLPATSIGRNDGEGVEEAQDSLEIAREELASSTTYVNNILRSMADSLMVITADMAIGAANPALLELLGYQEEDLIGESPGMVFGEEFARGAIIEQLMLQGSVGGVESSFLTREGQTIPVSVSGSIIQDEQGQFQGMVCVAQDISERKRMEEEKQKLHEQLLDTSRQLGMAEVASDVLHNVGNVLNSINVSIGVVSDIVAKSLVTDVKRISQLLEKHGDDLGSFFSTNPKGTQVAGFLKSLAEQLLEEQRLALSELHRLRENTAQAQHCVTAQQELAKPNELTESISLTELVEEAVSRHQALIEKSHISVMREFQDLPRVFLDKRQVLEVVADVIENACQAMETTEVRELILRIRQINGPPDSARIEVQDTGIGILQEDLTRIFGQGFTTKELGRGSSLHTGALVAKNLGGALKADSGGRGCGALFSLDLPGNFHYPEL